MPTQFSWRRQIGENSRMFHRIAGAFALSVAATLVIPAAAQTTAKKAPEGRSSQIDMETIVAKVNGKPITMGDMVAAKNDLPEPYNDTPMQKLYEPLLREMIERRLIAAAAEEAKLFEDPAVARRLKETRARILQDEYLRRAVRPALSEDKLKVRYEATAKSGGEDEVHARHILVATKKDADAVVAALEKGADFIELAKRKSTGPSGSKGGDLGFFKKSAMVPAFADVAFSLKAGEVSEPVKTQFGWHVIKLEERRKSPPPPFSEKIEELRKIVMSEVVSKILAELSAGAEIETFNLVGSPSEASKTGTPSK